VIRQLLSKLYNSNSLSENQLTIIKEKIMNRRQFIAFAVAAVASLKTLKAFAAELIKMNKDGSAAHAPAKAIGYIADVKDLKSAAKVKAAGVNMGLKKSKKVPPAKQTCLACSFYKGDKEKGTCTILPGVLVHAQGTCNTWVPTA
jgi:hypothetical protein